MRINIVFDTKTMYIAESLKKNLSLIHKKVYAKGDPSNLVYNVDVLDLETLETNITKI